MTFGETDDATVAALVATAADVVRLIGPRGGFRLLTFRCVNANGLHVHVATSIREEAAALEQLFATHGIHVKVKQVPPAKRRSTQQQAA